MIRATSLFLKAAFAVQFFLAIQVCAQAKPDFSGVWKQDGVQSIPARKGEATLRIEHHDPELNVETTVVRASGAQAHAIQRYTTDGTESVSTGADGDSFQTRIVWQGPDLVFTIVEHEDGRIIHSTELWSLRNDGAMLKRVRRSSKSEDEQTLVYTRVMPHAETAPTTVNFATEDGGVVYADVYGAGERAVLLAHGGRWTKESWAKQAPVLMKAGFEVLAIDFRGRGQSHGPGGTQASDAQLEMDVMAAVRYLHAHGARSVSIVGSSMGGAAAGDAAIDSKPGEPDEEIDRIVMLGASPNLPAERLKTPALFIVARNDANAEGLRLPQIQQQYDKAPQPKKLVILEGSAHAQALFETEQGERVMEEILRWLEMH